LFAILAKGIRSHDFFEERSVWKSPNDISLHMQRTTRALVFDLRYIGQEDITVVYHMKILKTRRRDDLRSHRARKDEAVVSKHHGSGQLHFLFSFLFEHRKFWSIML